MQIIKSSPSQVPPILHLAHLDVIGRSRGAVAGPVPSCLRSSCPSVLTFISISCLPLKASRPCRKYRQLLTTGAAKDAGASVKTSGFAGSTAPPRAILSSSSSFSIASLLIYVPLQIGQLVLRRTNQETRHSAWNSWPQTRSLRILSSSLAGTPVEGKHDGRAASSVTGVSGLSFAGSGGAGACSVERHIAL
jgi:hypothetical protein